MNYKVTANGKEIEYGALVEKSHFSDEEWSAIHAEMVKQNYPDAFKIRKEDDIFLDTMGALIDLEERYEALLVLLPQDEFSYAGTHPRWVADAVAENTLNKSDVICDVSDMIERCGNIEELKNELIEYFGVDQ